MKFVRRYDRRDDMGGGDQRGRRKDQVGNASTYCRISVLYSTAFPAPL
jgi:hypothetical protein